MTSMSPERNHAESEPEDTSERDSTTVEDEKSEAEKKDETQHEQLTRNFNELLQELRVTQTGVQILTGFLLTLPFTERFADLDNVQKFAYLAVLCGSVIATGLIIGPVAFHRILFRQGERRWLVHAANQAARAGLLMLALTTSGVVWLVFDLVTNRTAANVAGSLALIFFAGLWAGVPVISRRR
ncbi:DUF6328 family protein [Nocardioides sp. WL0053]|uniref:DUF6328 family protein n=2 Tax=Nocardioides jiangsuensis TaxID=2866161 RepID=A0ABS7RKK9_9ACTN|nr:DUF6328 family protein [Nocardioides jiangsuensis]